MLTLLLELYKRCGNGADILDYCVMLIVFLLSFTKLICLRFHLLRVYNNCSHAWDNWVNITDNNFKDIMISHAKTGKMVFQLQMVIAYMILSQYILNPVYQPRQNASNLSMQTVCTFMNLSSPGYFSVYFLESVGLAYLGFGFIGMDVLFFGMMMHLCGQLQILQKEFNAIGISVWHSVFVKKITTRKETR